MAVVDNHFGRNEEQDVLMMNDKYSCYVWSWRALIFLLILAVVLVISPLALPPLPPPPAVLLLVPVVIMVVLLVFAFSPSYSPEVVYNVAY
ncbi:hypothetical protein LIER_18282 [Lithospermum erythrorhizon]|uniref:Transmembrane protein n=1 Tax=Lithospermum erythrorhizon TaxID=34254 RepID=A0AAV3QIX5_LITER